MIGAVVLAAGTSTRMGAGKAALTTGPDGVTFLDAVLGTLSTAGIRTVRIVVAPGSGPLSPDHVVNLEPSAGMLSSLQCGLRALPSGLQGVLVWPVDHPLVRMETVAAIVAAFHESRAPVVVPSYAGRRGHPTLFAASVIPELLSADSGQGARSVVHAHGDRVELAVMDGGVIADIDTPEDYERHVRGKAR